MKTKQISIQSPKHPHARVYDAHMKEHCLYMKAVKQNRNPEMCAKVRTARLEWIEAIEKSKEEMAADMEGRFENVEMRGIYTYFERFPEKNPRNKFAVA